MEPHSIRDPVDSELRAAVALFARPSAGQSFRQLATSLGPFLAGCTAMYLACGISAWLVLALAIPTGAFMVRVFIVQHDCGHGSFFGSRRANTIVGRLCSLCTLTPFASWRRQHAQHHAEWNNLDRGDRGSDIYSSCLTVRAYLALSPRQRFVHRLVRHPLIANFLLPPLVFVLLYRTPFDTPRAWVRERRSVLLTNASLVALFTALVLLLGWRDVLLVHLAIMIVASILGVWLFTLQHRFPGAQWTGRGAWRYVDAAMDGSSWFDLPIVLRWFTGNIGFHHVHHLNQRIPNYRLPQAHDAAQAVRAVSPLGLRAGFAAPRLTLWDEASSRLVRFCDVAWRETQA